MDEETRKFLEEIRGTDRWVCILGTNIVGHLRDLRGEFVKIVWTKDARTCSRKRKWVHYSQIMIEEKE